MLRARFPTGLTERRKRYWHSAETAVAAWLIEPTPVLLLAVWMPAKLA